LASSILLAFPQTALYQATGIFEPSLDQDNDSISLISLSPCVMLLILDINLIFSFPSMPNANLSGADQEIRSSGSHPLLASRFFLLRHPHHPERQLGFGLLAPLTLLSAFCVCIYHQLDAPPQAIDPIAIATIMDLS
jgi:hypothetical protein